MINFLSADIKPGSEEELVLLTTLPATVESLFTAVEQTRKRYPTSIIRTSIIEDERCEIVLDPINYRDRIDHYMVHIKPAGNMISYSVYQIEPNDFRAVKKFIAAPTKK